MTQSMISNNYENNNITLSVSSLSFILFEIIKITLLVCILLIFKKKLKETRPGRRARRGGTRVARRHLSSSLCHFSNDFTVQKKANSKRIDSSYTIDYM